MDKFTLIEIENGQPVNLQSGSLDRIALNLLKSGKKKAAYHVATLDEQTTSRDFHRITSATKKFCGDGFYIRKNKTSCLRYKR